jgi:uncharacterized membrane protein
VSAKPTSFSRKFRNAFLTGLLIFLPLGTTIFVLNFLLGLFQEPVTLLAYELGLEEESFFFGLETLLAILGLLIGILSLTLLGFLSNYFLGRFFINLTEKILDKVPFLSTVYRSAKQIVETFGKDNRAVFKEVVLIEYPRTGCYVLGFVTTEASIQIEQSTGKKLTNVFVPTTPNPTSGFLLLLPESDIYPLDMTVGEGMKMLISGGAVSPPRKTSKTKSAASKGKGRRGSPDSNGSKTRSSSPKPARRKPSGRDSETD